MSEDSASISLVLGSGGARGLAHIGVIEWLEENGYRIDSIAGSSIGALVGGIYAAGKLDIYRDWVCRLERGDVIGLLDLSFGMAGFFKAEKLISTLRDLVGDYTIEELPISFTAVATDIASEREVWIGSGPLFDAIRASIAVPILLTPHEVAGRPLVDGGLLNPIPIAPTLRDNTELTVAVNLGANPDPNFDRPNSQEPQADDDKDRYPQVLWDFIDGVQDRFGSREKDELSMVDILFRSFDAMQNAVSRLKLAAYNPDAIIDVPRNVCRMHEYWRASEIIEVGKSRAEAARELLDATGRH